MQGAVRKGSGVDKTKERALYAFDGICKKSECKHKSSREDAVAPYSPCRPRAAKRLITLRGRAHKKRTSLKLSAFYNCRAADRKNPVRQACHREHLRL